MKFTRVYTDEQLRHLLASYVPGRAIEPDVAAVLVPTVGVVLEQRDAAQARCVQLLGRNSAATEHRKDLLCEVNDYLQAATHEPHDPATDLVISAVLTLHEYLAGEVPR